MDDIYRVCAVGQAVVAGRAHHFDINVTVTAASVAAAIAAALAADDVSEWLPGDWVYADDGTQDLWHVSWATLPTARLLSEAERMTRLGMPKLFE